MAVKHTKKLFVKALNKKFGKDFDLASQKTEYKRLGPEQNVRKREFMEYAKKLEGKRGMTGYNPYVHAGGIPLGQRQLVPYKLSSTEYVVEGDDLHFVNNPAMQQFWDDIRRTIVVGLDMAHEVLQKRLGKEVTPETINNYLEILNHAMPGAAVVQEHMVETHPGLVDDCNVPSSPVTMPWPMRSMISTRSTSTRCSPRTRLSPSRPLSARPPGRQCTSRPSWSGPATAAPHPGGAPCSSL